MDLTHHAEQAARAAWAEEIERAVDNLKRNRWDQWMRREFHKAAARSKWSADRKARWEEWRERRSHEAAQDEAGQAGSLGVTRPRVWVKGHVPEGFLDWVENRAGHDSETMAMLSECCFEVWERGR